MVITHRMSVLKKFGLPMNTSLSLGEISTRSGIPLYALQKVYNRGIGAYSSPSGGVSDSVRLKGSFKKGVHAPASMKLSKEQWAFARVYSFVDKGKTYSTADSDIAREVGY
jgi:hypothetical protein